MLQDQITIKNRHEKFIKSVCATEMVYGLKNKNGFATSSSVHYEDENGDPVGIICFWSESTRAKSCITEGWKKYQVTEIPLTVFMENWCVGMGNDGLLIGTQFDQNMFGFEAEPYELILDLVNELKFQDKDLDFKKFNGILDLEMRVRAIFE